MWLCINVFQNSKRKLILMLLNYNWLFYMLDNDNIISTSVSVAVEKIPTDEKVYRKCSFIVFYFAQPQREDQHVLSLTLEIVVYLLGYIQCSCKNHRIHFTQNLNRKKCNNRHMVSFIHCGSEKWIYRFPRGNKLADSREGGG